MKITQTKRKLFTFFIMLFSAFLLLSKPTEARAESLELIKTADKSEIFVHVPWGRYHVLDQDVWNRWGFNWGMMRVVSNTEMNIIPRGPEITKAVRPFGDPTVYVIENGQMRAVTSGEAFLLSGYKWSDVTDIEPAIIGTLPRGADLVTPKVVRSPKDGKIYYLWGGQKHHINSPYVWQMWNFQGYTDSDLVNNIPTGSELTNLVRPYGDPTVWVIDKGVRRALPSEDSLLLNGFNWGSVVDADRSLIEGCPIGDIFHAPTTVKAPGSDSIYYVSKGIKYLVKDAETYNNWGFGNFGSNVTAAINNFPSGGVLTRLSRTEDGTVWRVMNSTRKSIPSGGVFDGYRFNWADVTNIPTSAMWPLSNLGMLEYTVSSLDGVQIPSVFGYVGKEQHLWTNSGETTDAAHYALTNVASALQNGVAGNGAFGKMDPAVEKYYITMRWNYCDWHESDTKTDSFGRPSTMFSWINDNEAGFNTLKAWHKGRKLIVSNPATGRKIVVAVGESGPAIWVTRERGVVSGLSPEATDYMVGSNYGGASTGGQPLEYGWSVDQTLPLGPLTW